MEQIWMTPIIAVSMSVVALALAGTYRIVRGKQPPACSLSKDRQHSWGRWETQQEGSVFSRNPLIPDDERVRSGVFTIQKRTCANCGYTEQRLTKVGA